MSNYLYNLGKDLILRKTPLTLDPPHEDMVVGIVTALSEPAVTDPPGDIWGNLVALYRRLEASGHCSPASRPAVSPERVQRHQAMAGTPLSRWVAIRHGEQVAAYLDTEAVQRRPSDWAPVDTLAIFGCRLLRTGEYMIWEDEASPTGYQAAEILDTVT